MTAASYTTDLTLISNADAIASWSEPSATGWTSAGAPANQTENYIQGSASVSCQYKATGVGGLMYNYGSGVTIPADGAFLVWCYYASMNGIAAESSGGMRLICGNSNTAFYGWATGGSDTFPYGGWLNFAANPSASVTRDYTAGSPTGTWQYFGFCINSTAAISKGEPFAVDAVRYGRGEIRVVDGDGSGYGSFANMAANNDSTTNRWGLFQAIPGGYLWKGLMNFGNTTNYCDFRDSNKAITIDNTKKVTSAFNTIAISNNSTNVFWTAISISSLSSVSRGNFQVVDHSANVVLDTCTFTDMGTFDLRGSTAATGTTFRRCLSVSANSSNLQSSVFTTYQGASNTSALIWGDNTDTNGKLNGCTFTHGSVANNCHGLQLANQSLTSITLTNVNFVGYSSANGNPNSAIHVMKSSDSLTINITGGSTPTILSEGATVTVVSGSVDVTVRAAAANGASVGSARVIVMAANDSGPFPYQEPVTIVNTGTNANVHHTAHGLATNDKILIDGANHWQNNGVFTVTKISDDYYSYTLPSDPGSSPTGTIIATFVALEGLTDGTGTITTSRVYATDQPVIGWARKSSGSPYYKTAPITGSVDSGSGFSATAVLIIDE